MNRTYLNELESWDKYPIDALGRLVKVITLHFPFLNNIDKITIPYDVKKEEIKNSNRIANCGRPYIDTTGRDE